jgi:hypothetical protein
MRIIGTKAFHSHWPSNIDGVPESNLKDINL